MKKVLGILNAYDHRNRGDRAIIEVQIAWLRRKVPDAEFRVFSPAKEANATVFGDEMSQAPVIRTREDRGRFLNIVGPLGATLRAAFGSGGASAEFDACDAYFLCGGGYLYSSTAPGLSRQLWMHVGNSLLALSRGKPVMQFPQSWGPVDKALDAWVCRRLASALPRICSRGRSSTEMLGSWGYGGKTVEVPDVVVAMASLNPGLIRRQPTGSGELGIAPIDFGFAQHRTNEDLERYLCRVERVAQFYLESGGRGVVLFPQVQVEGSDEDLPVALELARRFSALGVSHRVLEDASWEEYFSEVGRMSVFLGSRMHACIFALCSGVPTVGLSYQPKFQALFSQLEMPERCVPITDFDSQSVAKMATSLATDETARAKVCQVVDQVSNCVLEGLDRCWSESGCGVLEPS